MYRTLPPQQGRKSQGPMMVPHRQLPLFKLFLYTVQGLPGFLWKHPKQEAKERKEKEREEKKARLEKEKASETLETGKEMSTSKN